MLLELQSDWTVSVPITAEMRAYECGIAGAGAPAVWLSSSLPKIGFQIGAAAGPTQQTQLQRASVPIPSCSAWDNAGLMVTQDCHSSGDYACDEMSHRPGEGASTAVGQHVHDLDAASRGGAALTRSPAPQCTSGGGGSSKDEHVNPGAGAGASSCSTSASHTIGGAHAATEGAAPPAPPLVWGSASYDATIAVAAAAAAAAAEDRGNLPQQHPCRSTAAISALLAPPTDVTAGRTAARAAAASCAAAASSTSGARPAAVWAAGEEGADSRCQSCPMAWPLHLLEAGGVLTALTSPPDSGSSAFVSSSGNVQGTPADSTSGALPGTASPVGAATAAATAATASHLRQLQPLHPQLQLVDSRRCHMGMEEALPEHPLLRLMSGAAGSGVLRLSSSVSGGAAAGTMRASEGLSWLLLSAEAAELAGGSSNTRDGTAAAAVARPGSSGGVVAGAVDAEAAARVVAALQPVMQELQAMRAEMGLLMSGSSVATAAAATAGLQQGASVSSGPWLASAAGSGAGLVAAPATGAVSAVVAGGVGCWRALRSGSSATGSAVSTATDAATVLSAVLSCLPDLEESSDAAPTMLAAAVGASAPLPLAAAPQRHTTQIQHPHHRPQTAAQLQPHKAWVLTF
eukprot:XP_001697316.1 predicted protein [Chlamydomonas reinhardtii]